MLPHRSRVFTNASIARLGLALLAFAVPCALPHAFAQQDLYLVNTRSLDFGRFVAGSGGAVILGPGGLRSRTGGVVLLHSPDAGQAAFSINLNRSAADASGMAVIVSLPPDGATRLVSGVHSMAVDRFVHTPAELSAVPPGGAALAVGATLKVAPNQAPGNYSGSFSLIVNYQ